MFNKVFLTLIAVLAIGIVVVGSNDKARHQTASAISAPQPINETPLSPIPAKPQE